jgi:hypothetical protein
VRWATGRRARGPDSGPRACVRYLAERLSEGRCRQPAGYLSPTLSLVQSPRQSRARPVPTSSCQSPAAATTDSWSPCSSTSWSLEWRSIMASDCGAERLRRAIPRCRELVGAVAVVTRWRIFRSRYSLRRPRRRRFGSNRSSLRNRSSRIRCPNRCSRCRCRRPPGRWTRLRWHCSRDRQRVTPEQDRGPVEVPAVGQGPGLVRVSGPGREASLATVEERGGVPARPSSEI